MVEISVKQKNWIDFFGSLHKDLFLLAWCGYKKMMDWDVTKRCENRKNTREGTAEGSDRGKVWKEI